MNVDPIKPYADMAKVIAAAAVAMVLMALLFIGGVYVGKGQEANRVATIQGKAAEQVSAKNKALASAGASLSAAASALRSVNAEAKLRIDEAAAAKRNAGLAGIAAAKAEHDAKARIAKMDKQIQDARRRPTCAALLSADLHKVCGL